MESEDAGHPKKLLYQVDLPLHPHNILTILTMQTHPVGRLQVAHSHLGDGNVNKFDATWLRQRWDVRLLGGVGWISASLSRNSGFQEIAAIKASYMVKVKVC